MAIIYREDQANLGALANKRIAVIGYGHLGRPIAFNLHESGLHVIVGGSTPERRRAAQDDGFVSLPIDEAVRDSQIIMLLLPDEAMPQFYLEQVSPHLQRGDMLVFASAYNVAFGFIEAPPFVDIGLIAPRILGAAVRERFLSDEGFLSFIAVGQDATGRAWDNLLGLAKAIGALRAGAIEVSFEQEAELDLFTQQAILPLIQHVLTKAAHLLIGKGYPPEAVLTDLYLSGELRYFLQQAEQRGLLPALQLASLTSQYGTLSRMNRFNDLKLERLMEVTLEEIHAGDFAQEWAKEYADGYRRLNTLIRSQQRLELNELEAQTLELLGRLDDSDT